MHNDILARYEQAQKISLGPVSNSLVMNDIVYPHWIEDSQSFWYLRDTTEGKQYRLVNSDAMSNEIAFDHAALANALQRLFSNKVVNADSLPIRDVSMTLSPLTIRFEAFDKRWSFNTEQVLCQREEKIEEQTLLSPNGQQELFVRNFNLCLRDRVSGVERPLTEDGSEEHSYARSSSSSLDTDPNTIQALWSPDSSRVLTVRLDSQGGTKRPIIDYVPQDGNLQPQISDINYPYPGDERIDSYCLLTINVSTGQVELADYRPLPFRMYTDFCYGFFTAGLAWWATDSRRAFFVDVTRGSKEVRVVALDTQTGKTRVLFEESSDTFVKLHHEGLLGLPFFVPIPETNELIWFSEHTGWGHLYLYDLSTGLLKHSITEGEWLVRDVLHYDPEKREVLVQTGARDASVSPYYRDVCKINIDTRVLTTLASGDCDHFVVKWHDFSVGIRDLLKIDCLIGVSGVSPCGSYMVVTRSRVDKVPVSILVDRNGAEVLRIETADVSGLPSNWEWPEPVKLKGADGKTDIYGVVFRPPGFSPDDQYPIVEYSSSMRGFSGLPQGAFSIAPCLGLTYFAPAALAALGFIVVMIEGRGTSFRNKAFQDYGFGDLRYTSDLEDRMSGIRQLAKRYPYMDLTRVGITTTEMQTNAVYALLHHSDFYSVVVEQHFHDPRFYLGGFGETYDGTIDQSVRNNKTYPEYCVESFEGKLLLIQGLRSHSSAGTFRLVEALQKANKDFDMLVLPNMGNNMTGYSTRREWDYLVRYLQGVEPPKRFKLINSEEQFHANSD